MFGVSSLEKITRATSVSVSWKLNCSNDLYKTSHLHYTNILGNDLVCSMLEFVCIHV